MIGKVLSHYKVLAEIGRGGMGVVYKALDLRLNREVALKVLPSELVADPERKRRFIQEAQAAAALEHPNIAMVFDIDEADGVTFIAMELIRGESLRELLRRERLPVKRSLEITAAVADGLAKAHEKGIIHRDVKPGNLMQTEDGRPKIIDFSLAKLLEPIGGADSEAETAYRGQTDPGKVMGTVSHMSPEQARGQKLDHRSDIFSLGIVLHEMLTGRLPFEAPTVADTMSAILNAPTPRLPSLGSEVPGELAVELQRIVDKCLSKEPGQRYQTAMDLALDLRAARNTLESGTTTLAAARPARKGWFFAAFGAAAAVVLLLLGWLVLRPGAPSRDEAPITATTKPSIAVMYFQNLSGEPDLEKILVEMLTTNLSRYEEIEVVGSQRLFDILEMIGRADAEVIDKRVATQVAQRAEVETMLLGSIVKVGERIRITSQLCDVATGNNIGAGQAEGTRVEDIFDMTDQLTEQVVDLLDVSSDHFADESPSITDVTTSSFEAYRFYERGLEDQYRFNWPSAEENFERAIALDPTFAMAHVQLATTTGRLPTNPFADLSPTRESLQRAKRYSARATEREQRYIDFYWDLWHRDYQAAAKLAKEISARYPEAKEFWLGFTSFLGGDNEAAIRILEKMVEIHPTYGNAYNALAFSYYFDNNHQRAISTMRDYLALQPDVSNPYDSAWELYMTLGQYDEAHRICEDALSRNPEWTSNHGKASHADLLRGRYDEALEGLRHQMTLDPSLDSRHLGRYYLFLGRYEEASAELRKATDLARSGNDPETELYRHLELGKMLALQGEYSEALEEFAEARTMSSDVYDPSFNPALLMTEYMAGWAMVMRGDLDEARTRAESIRRYVEEEGYDSIYMDYYNMLMARIHLAQGDVRTAKEELDEISSWSSTNSPHYQTLLAESNALLGNTSEAMDTHEQICPNVFFYRSGYGGDPFFYFLACSRVNYRLGQLHEQQGNTSQAIEYYEKALDQWKDADDDLPELADTRARLARLKEGQR